MASIARWRGRDCLLGAVHGEEDGESPKGEREGLSRQHTLLKDSIRFG